MELNGRDKLSKYIYYETELGILLHGDCLEILPLITEPVDLVLTDPPYGIGIDGSDESLKNGVQVRKAYEWGGWDNSIPDKDIFIMINKLSKNQIYCGANYFNEYLRQGFKGWVIWDKAQRGLTMSDCEIIYTSFDKPTRIITIHRSILWAEKPEHPTQKPIKLFLELLNMFSLCNDLILDSFFGSGTTGLACEKLNRRWIGIEISEKYCAIAKKRIEIEANQLKLFK